MKDALFWMKKNLELNINIIHEVRNFCDYVETSLLTSSTL